MFPGCRHVYCDKQISSLQQLRLSQADQGFSNSITEMAHLVLSETEGLNRFQQEDHTVWGP